MPVPEISRFYGIVICIYYADHPEPHFYASYAGQAVKVGISDLAVLSGTIPPTALRLVREWASINQDKLKKAWEQAMAGIRPDKIPPLE